jgi:hypothetical protein
LLGLQQWFKRNCNNDPGITNYHRLDSDSHRDLIAVVVTGRGLDEMPDDSKHSTRVAIISALVSLGLSIVFAAYIVGQRTGKVLDIEKWKNETSPRIERMDRSGTTSFDLFHAEYLRTQARQEEHLKDLDKRIRDLERDGVR